MDYAFILFIHFVTYEERLMRPPRHRLNRSRLRSRSVPNKVSSSHSTRHQCTRLCFRNPGSCSIYRENSHQCTCCYHRNFNNNPGTLLYGDNCTHRNCTNCHHPDLFPPPTSYINSPASHISFLSLTLEGDIICQPSKNEYLYAHHHHTRLAPYGGENQFVILDILPQCL